MITYKKVYFPNEPDLYVLTPELEDVILVGCTYEDFNEFGDERAYKYSYEQSIYNFMDKLGIDRLNINKNIFVIYHYYMNTSVKTHMVMKVSGKGTHVVHEYLNNDLELVVLIKDCSKPFVLPTKKTYMFGCIDHG